jgi:nitric oxide reductase large subunit
MSNEKPVPRILQQQPERESDPQQQRAGATDFQSSGQAQGGQVEGEGSYTATRDYQKNIKEYLEKADVESDAEAAKPRSDSEAHDLEKAEREAKSHSKGER